jgi:hypothetical protein
VRWGVKAAGFERASRYLDALRGLMGRGEEGLPKDIAQMLGGLAARAALNAQSFQAAPDFLWPFWVNRQLDPADPAYTPRGMNPLWYNQTHRNWTAIGAPRDTREAVVDPRGLLTPQLDGWSLDVVARVDAELYAPARVTDGYEQSFATGVPTVVGRFDAEDVMIITRAFVDVVDGVPLARLLIDVAPPKGTSCEVGVSLRPYNPEGIAPVFSVRALPDRVLVDGAPALLLRDEPARAAASHFWGGDAIDAAAGAAHEAECGAGLATCVLWWDVEGPRQIEVASFMHPEHATEPRFVKVFHPLRGMRREPSEAVEEAWRQRREGSLTVALPDERLADAFERARATLLLLDDGDAITPGPLTYHQHWFRDSAYLVTALGRLGHREDARNKLADYSKRQRRDGMFHSQDGEWDSNGQAIWTLVEHARLFDDDELLREHWPAIRRGALWLDKKRRGPRPEGHFGLLPAGLSAEHLGPHDWYLWDDFWGVAGLRDAAWAAKRLGHHDDAKQLEQLRLEFESDLEAALAYAEARQRRPAMPAAPGRGYDAGMIGNIAGVYPLQLMRADDDRVVDTLDVIEERFFHDGAFLQSMVHSGLNAYLTLQCAQVHLFGGRAERAWRLVDRVLALASPTGTWPEAVHPRTGGGCMGDGCHGWAAADLVLFARNALLVEHDDVLRLTPAPTQAFEEHGVSVERAPTWFGRVSYKTTPDDEGVTLELDCDWHAAPEAILWRLPFDNAGVVVDGARIAPKGRTLHLPADAKQVRVTRA